ncbi:MAG TPA: isoleucine--tRNA ligase [bacterium]|mgnify:CR=1 FL=1|nr:isoleucine--tRNA ligase [bacterium]
MAEHNQTVEREAAVLKFWQEKQIFEKSLSKNSPKGEYVFYDGPPFATGVPHYGHLVGSIMKDLVPRYWTMKGYHVGRVWGWDCHGLPIENIVEKEMKLGSKADIEKMGVANFCESCRANVQTYVDDWKKIIPRVGRWVDMENAYKTMDVEFMESIWWVFKTLWDKGLIYEGHKSMHICPRCETTLSNFEVNQNYQDVEDLSITVKFKLLDEENTYVLAWTTTPWTLPGNVALAVGANLTYVKVKINDEHLILAAETLESVLADQTYEKVEAFNGEKLLGKKYQPLFDYFVNKPEIDGRPIKNWENAYTVQAADFVTTTDGTGVVHIAPAFGEDDLNLSKAKNLPLIQHVLMNGTIIPEVTDFAGESVKKADDPQAMDKKIIEYLQAKDLLFKVLPYQHSYPFCWRCETPLLNYATSSWFVDVPKFRDQLLANNEKVRWVPDHFKHGRFGKWLEGVREWSISRDRYWGNPLPVWRCDACKTVQVLGSKSELEQRSGQTVTDLHKHKIDDLTWTCSCGGHYHRVPEVLDCWFESGAMPYAQVHYPFENKELFEKTFPAQFIAEGQDQTRGWFYTLMVLATALFDKPAFENVVVNGIVLAEDGRKMSKRLKNYPDVSEILDKYGADALRLYLMTSPIIRAEDLCFSEAGVAEMSRKALMILSNVHSFYKMYAPEQVEELRKEQLNNILDQWIIAKLNKSISDTSKLLDEYELAAGGRVLLEFIDELSTWYVRRSRDRFKSEDVEDKNNALAVLRYVLLQLTKLMAPYAPFIAETIYLDLHTADAPESVHLCDWPSVEFAVDATVLEKMNEVRVIVEAGLALRAARNVKIRQALGQATIKADLPTLYLEILKDELNLKEINIATDFPSGGEWQAGETIAIDFAMTDALLLDGTARELVRFINMERKNAGFTINDEAKVSYYCESDLIKRAINEMTDYLRKNTRTQEFVFDEAVKEQVKAIKVNGEEFYLVVMKV